MTRKDFFKKLGIGVAAVVMAPKVIAKKQGRNANEKNHEKDIVCFRIKYWYPYSLPKVGDVVWSKKTTVEYRVINIEDGKITISIEHEQFSYPLDREFCETFLCSMYVKKI